jgi:hypothetical protein
MATGVPTSAGRIGLKANGGKVLGLFARNTMPVEWRGVGDAKAERIARVDGRVRWPEPFACEPNPGSRARRRSSR